MPWANLPATNATDWSQVDFLNQFVDAYNERADLIIGLKGGASWLIDPVEFIYLTVEQVGDSFIVGDDVSHQNPPGARPSILEIQTRLQTLARYFGAPDLFPVGQQVEIDATTIAAGLYDLDEWRDDAGIPTEGYTRKYPREIDTTGDAGTNGERARLTTDAKIYEHAGGSWSLATDQAAPVDIVTDHGTIEPGDYIGPWIFNELQAGIQALEYVRFPVFGTGVGIDTPYDTPHWGAYGVGAYVDELSPGVPDLVGMAAAAHTAATPDWQEDRFVGSIGGLQMAYTKKNPDQVVGGVRRSRHSLDCRIPQLSLNFWGVRDDPGLSREITNLYFWPGETGSSSSVFYDFGTGSSESWNDISGDYDPEVPATGESWTASFQWPFTTNQTAMPADLVASAGWFDPAYVSAVYEMPYQDVATFRNCFAGYVRFSGFDFA